MKRFFYILLCLSCCHALWSQTANNTLPASSNPDSVVSHQDSLIYSWKPDPLRAVWMGAIIPGYGQIYNRSYWKLPIVYGAFMGSAYAIIYTNGKYSDYKAAYRDILTDNELSTDPTRTYNAILPEGYTIERLGGRDNYTRYLENRQNSFRRYRDISIVAAVVVYALSLIDAYVDAQLYDFDISEDLSLNIAPEIHTDPIIHRTNTEINVAIHF